MCACVCHVCRQDHRHNISPHFLPIYYSKVDPHPGEWGWEALLGMLVPALPAAVLLLVSVRFAPRSLPVALLLQTALFVTLNRVCTAQYFTWYLCLAPLATPYYSHKAFGLLRAAAAGWVLCLGLWLHRAYELEFAWVAGRDMLVHVWACSLLFYLCNMACIAVLVYAFEEH